MELWLHHAGCRSLATGAEVEVVPPGDVFMTRGWGEIARACRAEGALAIHFEYDGAATLLFKVFNKEGEWLECCPGGDNSRDAAMGARPAAVPFGPSSSSGDSWESSDSPEPSDSPESSNKATCRQAPIEAEAQLPRPPGIVGDTVGPCSCFPCAE